MSDGLCTDMTLAGLLWSLACMQVFAFGMGVYACWVWHTGKIWP